MWQRYKPVAIVAGLLFVVSSAAELVAGKAVTVGGWSGGSGLLLVGLIMLVATYRWARDLPLVRVVPDVLLSVTLACLLYVLLSQFYVQITAKTKFKWALAEPFTGGAGSFFAKVWLFYGAGLVGALVGWMIAVALGQDQRAKALKQFTKTVSARPHRPVRR